MAVIDNPVSGPLHSGGAADTESRILIRAPGVDRVLEVTAAFTLVTSVVGLGSALAGVFHAPQVLLGSLLLTGAYAFRTRGLASGWPGVQPRWRHLALLLLITLFFRLPAYHYVLGGQDEGLYTNIAHHLIESGRIDANDEVMQKLEGSPYLQRYLEDNRIYEGQSPTLYLLGVYARQPQTSHLVFQFYYLFPVWMAVVGGIAGLTWGVYALTFFALLSVAFFYRLTLLLTRSHGAALVSGGLLALNPLHAFFSKFPVTEMPTLAFSLIGFTLLATFWTAEQSERKSRWLWLSVGAFLCLFLTRISGFMYMPFFGALAFASLIWDKDLQRRNGMQRWMVAVTIVYFASVYYGLHWSRYYSRDMYFLSFEPLFGHHWKWAVEILVLGSLMFWIGVALWARLPQRRERYGSLLIWPVHLTIGCIVFAGLLLGLLKIYWLGWTNHYSGADVIDTRWHLSNGGWNAAAASSLSTLVVYVGPFLAIAFLVLIWRRSQDARLEFLRCFAGGFFVYAALLQWILPYGPYYARYLLSELVPYLILFVVCTWAALRKDRARAVLSASLFLSLVYATALSAAQIGKEENDGAYRALARLTAPVEKSDLILLDSLHNNINTSEVKTPLLYTFGHDVVTIGSEGLADNGYLAELNGLYDDLFLISPNPKPPPGFDLIDSIRYRVMAFRQTHFFPDELTSTENTILYLYRLDRVQFPLASPLAFKAGSIWLEMLDRGWSYPENWGIWSSGQDASLTIDPRQLPKSDDGLILALDAHVFVKPSHPRQRVEVRVDGSPIAQYSVTYPTASLAMQIPIRGELLDSMKPIVIDFALPDAISPKALGMGGDTRELAIGLTSARFSPSALPAQSASE